MNSLWPAATRFSCRQSRITAQTCHKVDSLAARLAQRVRPYSVYTISPCRRGSVQSIKAVPWSGRTCLSAIAVRKASLGIKSFSSHRIITRYEDLPVDYTDEKGLSYREKSLTNAEAEAVFGKECELSAADRALRVMHGRRVAGTLADPSLPSYLGLHEQKAQSKALEWLRGNVPVDEVQSAGLRAEKELAELGDYIVKDSERIGLYKRNPNEKEPLEADKGKGIKSVYGESGLDFIRKRNEAKFDKKEAAKKAQEEKAAKQKRFRQAAEIRQNTGSVQTADGAAVELRDKNPNPWLEHYVKQAQLSTTAEPPKMTISQRLWPSALVTLVVVALAVILPLLYTPPKNSQRMWPDMPPAAATVLSIIAANGLVYLLWHFPPFWRIGNRYFVTTPGTPIALSLVGNVFSHQTFGHFAANMLVLFIFGSRLHDEVGRANFLSVYMASGALASMVSLTSFVLRGSFVSASLGASGAIYGVLAAYIWLRRDEPLRIFFLPEPEKLKIPMWVALAFLISVDVYGMSRWNRMKIVSDHWAHLGGMFTGVTAAEILKSRARGAKQREIERRRRMGVVGSITGGRI